MVEGCFGWCVALSTLPSVGPFSSVLHIPSNEYAGLEYIPTSLDVLAILFVVLPCIWIDDFLVAVYC
jgi:hypothetical protein